MEYGIAILHLCLSFLNHGDFIAVIIKLKSELYTCSKNP